MHSVVNGGKSIKEKRMPKIEIGFRVGKLEVVSATDQRKNGYTVWNCRCDCGKEALVPRKQLIGGYTKSCGCLGRPPLKDWIGNRFGRLEVISYDRKENGSHYWKCKCDCGNTVSVCQSSLKIGHTKSCGCLADPRRVGHFVEGTHIEAIRSKTIFKNNTSGIRGVYLNKKSGKWVVQIAFKKKKYTLGSYLKIEDAAKARKEAEDHLFGEFLEWYDSQYPEQKRETGPT